MNLDKLNDTLGKVLGIVGTVFFIVLGASFTLAIVIAAIAMLFEFIRAAL